MIPQKLHVVWLGSSLPPWARGNLDLFTEHNPAWVVKIHDTWPPDGAPPELAAHGRNCTQYCQLADLYYIWLLASVGGVVMDLDSMTRRAFGPLCDHQAFSSRHNNSDRRLTNGLMGGGPGGAFGRALEWLTNRPGPARPPRCHYGPDLMTRLFDRVPPLEDFTILPWAYFYPLGCGDRKRADAYAAATSPEARDRVLDQVSQTWGELTGGPFAVHLWGCEGSSHKEIVPRE